MKFSVHRDPLLEALQKTQSVVEKRNTVQILANILCVVRGNELSLSATDLEVGVRITLPVENAEDGRLTLSAKYFFDIVKELPSNKLEITRKDNNWVEIICGKSKFNVVSLAADEYPSLPSFEERNYFDARTASLREMIDKTSFAVSTDATRYHLNGVFFEPLESNLMRMTATDGHRLSFVDKEVFLEMPEFKRGIIIPRKGLQEFRKFLTDAPEAIGLAFERGYIFCQYENTHLFIRLIEGEYPDYRLVIPKAADKTAKIPRDPFMAALKRINLFANEKSGGVKVSLQNQLLTITSSNPDMGDAREEMDIEYAGESVEIGFNARYLLECLSVVVSKNLELHFKDRLSPGILRGEDQQNHTYVIMPMRM